MHKKHYRPEIEALEDRTVPAQLVPSARPDTAEVHSAITRVMGNEALPQPHIQQLSREEVIITWDGVESSGEHGEHARVYVEYHNGSLKLSRSVSPQNVLIDVRSQHISASHDKPELHIGPGSRTIKVRIANEHFQQVFFEREYATHNGFSDVIEVPTEHELEEILHARHEEEHARHTAFENLVHMEHAKHAHNHAHSDHEHPHEHEEHAHTHEHAHAHAEHEHEHHHHHHEHEHEGHTEQELADAASLIGSYATPKSPAEAMAILSAREAKLEANSNHKEDHHGEKPAHTKHAHGKAVQHSNGNNEGKQHSHTEHDAPKGHDEPRLEPQQTPAKESTESAAPKMPEKEEELSATHKGAIGAALAGVLAYVPFMERLRRKKKAA